MSPNLKDRVLYRLKNNVGYLQYEHGKEFTVVESLPMDSHPLRVICNSDGTVSLMLRQLDGGKSEYLGLNVMNICPVSGATSVIIDYDVPTSDKVKFFTVVPSEKLIQQTTNLGIFQIWINVRGRQL